MSGLLQFFKKLYFIYRAYKVIFLHFWCGQCKATNAKHSLQKGIYYSNLNSKYIFHSYSKIFKHIYERMDKQNERKEIFNHFG